MSNLNKSVIVYVTPEIAEKLKDIDLAEIFIVSSVKLVICLNNDHQN
jgi:hypothetical protein